MDPQDYAIAHLEGATLLARALKARRVQIEEHHYHGEAFGSWYLTLRHEGEVLQLIYDGRDDHMSVRRSPDRKRPYSFGPGATIGSGKGLGSLDAHAIDEICCTLTSDQGPPWR